MRHNAVVIIRTGGPSDAALATELWERANAARENRIAIPPTEEQIATLHSRFADPKARILLGFEGVELIATALAAPARTDGGAGSIIPEAAHVSLIGVAPKYWGHGYGQEILQALTTQLARVGYRRLSLSVIADNSRARRLYERCGWIPDGTPEPHPSEPDMPMQRYELVIANRKQSR
jgi:RimJ/RimL family protein N-acetyltransferase